MQHRSFLRGLSGGIVPASLLVMAIISGVAALAADDTAEEAVPRIAAENFRRMPDPPGPVECLCFSPDARQLALACQNFEGHGSSVYLLDCEGGRTYRKLYELPHAIKVYAIAWEPDGKRMALSVWNLRSDDPEPYQTQVDVIAADTGELQTRRGLWTERDPVDKGGIWVRAVWLDADRLLALKEGSQDLYEISLADTNDDSMKTVFSLAQGDDYWMSLSTLDAGRIMAISVRRSPRRYRTVQLRSSGEKIEIEDPTYNGETVLAWTDCSWLLASRKGYYRGFEPRGNGDLSYVGELVDATGMKRLARIPEKSPFSTPGFNLFYRHESAMSPDGSQLALLEVDAKREARPNVPLGQLAPAERAEVLRKMRLRPERNPLEPFGRLVIANIESYMSPKK